MAAVENRNESPVLSDRKKSNHGPLKHPVPANIPPIVHAHMAAAYSARPLITMNQPYPMNPNFPGYQRYPYVNRGVVGNWPGPPPGVNFIPGPLGPNNVCGPNWIRPAVVVPPNCPGNYVAPPPGLFGNFYRKPHDGGQPRSPLFCDTARFQRTKSSDESSSSCSPVAPKVLAAETNVTSDAAEKVKINCNYEGMPHDQMSEVFGLSKKVLVKKPEKFEPSWNQMKSLIEFKVRICLLE